MKKILVPVDFSDHTDITCTYAIELAGVEPTELMLFNTYFDQIVLTDTTFPDSMNMNAVYNEELIMELHAQAESNMKKLSEKITLEITGKRKDTIQVRTLVAGGDIEMELRFVCEDYHPDLVVMGAKGKGRNVHVWGRVTTYIINHAKVPIFTVPEITSFMGFGTIMFAADLSEGNLQALHHVMHLLKPFLFRINVVHFITKKEDEDQKMQEVMDHFRDLASKGKVIFDLVKIEEDNQRSLDEYIASNGIEVIVFQPHKRSLFYRLFSKSITRKNLFSANIPLLAIPVTEKT